MKPTEILTYLTSDAVAYFVRYLKAIPSDKLSWKPCKTSKSPLEIAQECVALCDFLTRSFKRNFKDFNLQTWEACRKEASKLGEKNKLAIALKTKTRTLLRLLMKIKPSRYKNLIKSPWNPKKIELIDLVYDHYWHLSYHVGQLAYIQTLYGDTKMY